MGGFVGGRRRGGGGVNRDGEPAARCLGDFGIFETDEARDGGAGEVNVEDTD